MRYTWRASQFEITEPVLANAPRIARIHRGRVGAEQPLLEAEGGAPGARRAVAGIEYRRVGVWADRQRGRRVHALGWDRRRILHVAGPVGRRHGRPDAHELRFGVGEPRRAQGRGVERRWRDAPEVPRAAAQDRCRYLSRAGAERPCEAGSRRDVHLAWDAVGPDA